MPDRVAEEVELGADCILKRNAVRHGDDSRRHEEIIDVFEPP